ncbi:unnamed protein product, partial [Ectocarpus sp. 8 AP-2014]
MAEKGGGKEVGDASSPNTGSTRLTYGQVHAALFRSQDLEALVAAFKREGELREKDELRIALKRQQFEESMAKRRSGPIAEVVKAYAAGLGYRPSTKKKHKRIVDGAGGNGGGGGAAMVLMTETQQAWKQSQLPCRQRHQCRLESTRQQTGGRTEGSATAGRWAPPCGRRCSSRCKRGRWRTCRSSRGALLNCRGWRGPRTYYSA